MMKSATVLVRIQGDGRSLTYVERFNNFTNANMHRNSDNCMNELLPENELEIGKVMWIAGMEKVMQVLGE